MDAQQTPDADREQAEHDDAGSSKTELLTMSLFGVMVIIASVCFVIW